MDLKYDPHISPCILIFPLPLFLYYLAWSKTSRTGGDPYAMVTERMCQITRQLQSPCRIFPIPTVYGLLARLAFKYSSTQGEPATPGWAMETLIQCRVSFPEAYRALMIQMEDKVRMRMCACVVRRGWREQGQRMNSTDPSFSSDIRGVE